ncbi:MAG: peptide chain release factor 3 [Acidobacteria bacterium]|nr:peptide chain release factor 3 [Acidobacteriota bacterium]
MLVQEVARRRTFAIISHPDAGKTTLTEKALLYAGAIDLAGAVRGRKTQRHVVSDWMAIERDRGISITTAAIEFDLRGCRITLLDTPGHRDFSEDTYRTLMAVDSVVMVIDAAKGIEAQTRKLFEVARLRDLPMLTFINKLDLPGRDPLDLLDEIEQVLGVSAAPMNWPLGTGDRFKGVYDLRQGEVLFYERVAGNQRRAPVTVSHANDPRLDSVLGDAAAADLREAIQLLEAAGTPFNRDAYLQGRQTPVFFGSALANFGIEAFLSALVEFAPPPQARTSDGRLVEPTAPDFSGFIFKIQANMNPRHRDRVAFVRVCSGVLVKDMQVINARLQQPIRLSRPSRFFGRDRETVETAYPGDVVGLVNPGQFAIGDTLYAGTPVQFPPMPHFAAEFFAVLRLEDVRVKQFDEGVRQLEEEGLMQVLFAADGRRDPMLGVVGALQFDIIVARLRSEYGVTSRAEPLPYVAARWLSPAGNTAAIKVPYGAVLAADRSGRTAILLPSTSALQYAERENPGVRFLAVA